MIILLPVFQQPTSVVVSNGGMGGANDFNTPTSATFSSEYVHYYNSGSSWTVPEGVSQVQVICKGGGGGGSANGRGGAGGYAEALLTVIAGASLTVSAGAPSAAGSKGNISYVYDGTNYIGAGGGGGAGDVTSGASGASYGATATDGTDGSPSSGGDGGRNGFAGAGISMKVSKRSATFDSEWADGASVGSVPVSRGGNLSAGGGEGKVYIRYNSTVANPTILPSGDTFYLGSPTTFTLSTATSGASMRYTTDGLTTPTSTVGTLYTGPFDWTASGVFDLRVRAYKSGSIDSAVVSKICYFMQIHPVSISPDGGTFDQYSTTYVTLSDVDSAAYIRYTTDGSTPTESSGTLYSGPFLIGGISGNVTVKAIAYYGGYISSPVTSKTFSFTNVPFVTSFFSGSGSAGTEYTFTASQSGAWIEMFINGSMVASGSNAISYTSMFDGGGAHYTVYATSSLGGYAESEFIIDG